MSTMTEDTRAGVRKARDISRYMERVETELEGTSGGNLSLEYCRTIHQLAGEKILNLVRSAPPEEWLGEYFETVDRLLDALDLGLESALRGGLDADDADRATLARILVDLIRTITEEGSQS